MEKAWEWLKKEFTRLGKFFSDHVIRVAVTVTNGVKDALASGTVDFIATIADGLTKSNVPSEIVGLIKLIIPKILAFELAIEGLPPNPTQDDIIAFETRALAALGISFQKDKVWATITAQVILEVKSMLNDGKITFAEAFQLGQDVYKDYKQDMAIAE